MPPQLPERRWGVVIGNIVFVGLVTLATVPAYTFVDASWRPMTLRLAAALVLGVLLRQVYRAVVGRIAEDRTSPFDAALSPPDIAPRVDRHLVELDTLLKWAVRSRQYFEHIVWPRITALAGTPPMGPRCRRFGRGPSLESLREVISAIETPR